MFRIRSVLMSLTLAAGVVTLPAAPAAAAAGTVLLAGNQWFGGAGVPVCNPTWSTCGGQAAVGSAGQCVELAQRFYQSKGWYRGYFPRVAGAIDIYTNAAGLGMTRQAQGAITTVVPGDMLVLSGGSTRLSDGRIAGHVAIVDGVTVNADGSRTLSTVNQNAKVVRQAARWHAGTVDSFWSTHQVAGIVHDPDNRNSGTGSGGSAGYPDVVNGGGSRLAGPRSYLDVSSIGQVYAWNGTYSGGQPAGNTGITDVAMAPNGGGYWMTDSVGHVYAYPGGNPYFGGSPKGFSGRIVSMAARPDGAGYWLMSEAGQVYSYPAGNPYYGGSPTGYAGRFVAIESTTTGRGYWLLTSAGQVYAYGDAQWRGNATGFQRAIVSMSRTPGNGYVLVSVTGQVYAFGDASYFGNVPSIAGDAADISYALPGMSPGYLVVSRTGAHYAFGSVPFLGNPTGFTGQF
ncbi:CHAP domain-containing protein [Actinoplanes sp. HUAS TT8]|uniref:CHAP domain-containing protein n=1 Tax=Actinoplanes sp. HUAS TT8 TaxID=3447453 RepID=UPI003F51C390